MYSVTVKLNRNQLKKILADYFQTNEADIFFNFTEEDMGTDITIEISKNIEADDFINL